MNPGLALTLLGHIGPFWLGELILAHANSALHSWGDGLARVGVERWKTTQTAKKIINT